MRGPLKFAIPSTSGCTTFDELAEYVRSLPYSRTSSPADPFAVLREKRGTCSSKHRLLATIAHDFGHHEIQLAVGIYEMSEQNTPGVGGVLRSAALRCIPEAHCYLIVGGERFDFTGLPAGASSPFDALLEEYIVAPAELPETKDLLHRNAIDTWARRAGISAASAWNTREACIAALAARDTVRPSHI